ncbi:hypothetical protein SAMN04488543_1907 [Friedmanniella luteola]|uniref:Uncharacterized protein n=1 Tax=Friedmanniella luteola TaxID=546871 RepID=A0A1H1SZG1_9ACTN|nr:hypothetical protein SAMN04488543_1907 [Friedmanniella luteola]
MTAWGWIPLGMSSAQRWLDGAFYLVIAVVIWAWYRYSDWNV